MDLDGMRLDCMGWDGMELDWMGWDRTGRQTDTQIGR